MNYCSKETDLQAGGVDGSPGKYRLKICGSSQWISSQFIARHSLVAASPSSTTLVRRCRMCDWSLVVKTSATKACYLPVNSLCNKETKMKLTRIGQISASNSARHGPFAVAASPMIGLIKSWRA
jgi:hypothetical protein